jgi:hypothetical protein
MWLRLDLLGVGVGWSVGMEGTWWGLGTAGDTVLVLGRLGR